ncbi:MAG: hypothetical protein IBX50_07965 [Marinospirillum sp.]|uniref:hypothetical protein n=1 Tax=Marinospirillum sp. TaxID=2183934 RepID=UPI001A045A8B|nr:hypothetical protein [Marinospirillum sp.]MBE0506641.1 hypothetical protein [Marinospirillum sp.]
MNENLKKVLEWAVWFNLEKHKNAELLLLKGHLILEVFMDSFLSMAGYGSNKDASFHKKVKLISDVMDETDQGYKIVRSLFFLNKIRNKLAHEWQFSLVESGLNVWVDEALANFPVVKVAKYNYRTKLIHAFAALARALMEYTKNSNKQRHGPL